MIEKSNPANNKKIVPVDSKPPKPPINKIYKPYKKYTIRIYVNDSAYNGELIDEFTYKAENIRTFTGIIIKDAEGEIQKLFEDIGKNGYIVNTSPDIKTYYPSHRIHYIEAVEEN